MKPCFKWDPVRMAVIAAFLTLAGDFIALILAINELQKQEEEEEQADRELLKQQIRDLQRHLDKYHCNLK